MAGLGGTTVKKLNLIDNFDALKLGNVRYKCRGACKLSFLQTFTYDSAKFRTFFVFIAVFLHFEKTKSPVDISSRLPSCNNFPFGVVVDKVCPRPTMLVFFGINWKT